MSLAFQGALAKKDAAGGYVMGRQLNCFVVTSVAVGILPSSGCMSPETPIPCEGYKVSALGTAVLVSGLKTVLYFFFFYRFFD